MGNNIILVDDERKLLKGLESYLSASGYVVTTAENGLEAFEKIQSAHKETRSFDLLVLDIQMPVMNGLELISALGGAGIAIPFIVMSGFRDKELVVHLLREVCSDYVNKPFPLDDLVKRARAILAKSAFKSGENISAKFGVSQASHKVSVKDNWVEIAPQGDVTRDSAETIRRILIDMLERGLAKFRFDLAGVGNIDPVGIGLMMFFGKIMSELDNSSRLEITNPRQNIKVLLDKSGLWSFYSTDRQHAVN
ncbi:MAG: response regulator [Nitrospinae bacterium]|nr:response regulator [Nitrospinota bacterium]